MGANQFVYVTHSFVMITEHPPLPQVEVGGGDHQIHDANSKSQYE